MSGSVAHDPDQLAAMRATTETGFDKIAVIHRFVASGESEYGNVTGGWIAGDPVPCKLTHTDGHEVTADRETQIADWFARFPYGTVIDGNDRIVVDDVTFEVTGPPSDELTHIRAQLVHITG